ncbi:hypothetical protein [Pseudorhodoplanes sinuspersici]|nr:hypothetical protein [Pseudorhodoplanes sinuspersici]
MLVHRVAGLLQQRRKAMSHPLTNCNESPEPSLPVSKSKVSVQRMESKRRSRVAQAAGLAALAALMIVGVAIAGEHHSNPWLLSWIPATCCVTNDCCWEVSERELRSLPDDEWEVRSTGQIRKRTAYSPDGKFYRCACDYDNVDKHWIKHQGANTRCIFVPMRSAAASFFRR